jgi:hypothetical protein
MPSRRRRHRPQPLLLLRLHGDRRDQIRQASDKFMNGWQRSTVAMSGAAFLAFLALLASPALVRGATPAAAAAPAAAPAPTAAPAGAPAAAPAGPPVSAPPPGRPTPVPAAGPPTMTQEWAPQDPGIRWGWGGASPIIPSSQSYGGPLTREGPVAHAAAAASGPPPPAEQHRVILRDGSSLAARSEPQLAGRTVRFTDQRGTLVSVRVSEVDLAATAAANHLAWPSAPAPAPTAAPAASPTSRRH